MELSRTDTRLESIGDGDSVEADHKYGFEPTANGRQLSRCELDVLDVAVLRSTLGTPSRETAQ